MRQERLPLQLIIQQEHHHQHQHCVSVQHLLILLLQPREQPLYANDGVAGANGLPRGGVSAHWAANVITISGTPTASGIFSYSIALTAEVQEL